MANETNEEIFKDLDYHEIMWAEMAPYLYDGKNCDQVRPRWHCFCDGDMDSEHIDEIQLDPKLFPPGTKVLVMVPECPRCNQIQEFCESSEFCDFDWALWRDSKYS